MAISGTCTGTGPIVCSDGIEGHRQRRAESGRVAGVPDEAIDGPQSVAIGDPQPVAIGDPQGRQRPAGQQRPTVPAVQAACIPIVQLLVEAREGR